MIGGDYTPHIERYKTDSEAALAALPHARLDVVVPATGHHVDVFMPPSPRAPILVYIHGGYWQELSRGFSRFAAASLHEAGWGCVVVGYPLAPEARIGDMIDVCAEAIQWTADTLNPQTLVVAGSSAGAHLAASAVSMASPPLAAHIDGLILFSGVYDLEPLIGTSVDNALHLSADEARALSPLHNQPANVPSFITWGEHETPWFVDMSHTYADHLRAYNIDATTYEYPGRNHFDIVHALQDPASAARRWLAERTTKGT